LYFNFHPIFIRHTDYGQYVFPNKKSVSGHILTFLSTDPPTPEIALGTSSTIPPTPDSLQENPKFSNILQAVIAEHAHNDPEVISQAQAMASSGGSSLGQIHRAKQSGASGGGASDQGGMGSGGRGGWVHVSDQRNIPDYGRIAWPEDIFGSLEVDGRGNFVDGHGRYQPSGTYRMVTRDGILGLSQYLREKLVERLQVEEANIRN
jgi:hypothetical protein